MSLLLNKIRTLCCHLSFCIITGLIERYKYSSLKARTDYHQQNMAVLLPANVADGRLRLTCQREHSLTFHDQWVLISPQSGFHQIDMADTARYGGLPGWHMPGYLLILKQIVGL